MRPKLIVCFLVLLVAGVAAAIVLQPPAWIVLLLGSSALAVLYIVARQNSRYDPLDPRFGSCIPPIRRVPKDP